MVAKSLEFHLKIFRPDRGRLLEWLPMLGIFGLFALAALGILLKGSGLLIALYEVVVLGLGGYYSWQAFRNYAFVNSLVRVMSNRLVVLDEQEYQELAAVSHTAIAAYKYSCFDGGHELRITRRDAPPLRLRANGKLLEPGDFAGMVRAFEACIAAQPTSSRIIREKTFFEKRISTWLLVGLTLGLWGLIGMLVTRPQPVQWGRLVSLLAYYFVYAAQWWAARAERCKP